MHALMTFSQSVFKHTCIFLTYIYTFKFQFILKIGSDICFFDRMAQFKWILLFRRKKIFIFASTGNVKPLTANRGLRLGVNKINVNLKLSIE